MITPPHPPPPPPPPTPPPPPPPPPPPNPTPSPRNCGYSHGLCKHVFAKPDTATELGDSGTGNKADPATAKSLKREQNPKQKGGLGNRIKRLEAEPLWQRRGQTQPQVWVSGKSPTHRKPMTQSFSGADSGSMQKAAKYVQTKYFKCHIVVTIVLPPPSGASRTHCGEGAARNSACTCAAKRSRAWSSQGEPGLGRRIG